MDKHIYILEYVVSMHIEYPERDFKCDVYPGNIHDKRTLYQVSSFGHAQAFETW